MFPVYSFQGYEKEILIAETGTRVFLKKNLCYQYFMIA
jgi:hypothetical protein